MLKMVLQRLSELTIQILSYENQSGDLKDKSTDWFLYDQARVLLYLVYLWEVEFTTFLSHEKVV